MIRTAGIIATAACLSAGCYFYSHTGLLALTRSVARPDFF